jgi:hypothetical protein
LADNSPFIEMLGYRLANGDLFAVFPDAVLPRQEYQAAN